jgi:hypothetical protein
MTSDSVKWCILEHNGVHFTHRFAPPAHLQLTQKTVLMSFGSREPHCHCKSSYCKMSAIILWQWRIYDWKFHPSISGKLVYHNIEQMPKKLDQQLGWPHLLFPIFLLISNSIFWFNSFSLSSIYMGLVGMDNNGPQTSWTRRMVSKRNYGNCFIW